MLSRIVKNKKELILYNIFYRENLDEPSIKISPKLEVEIYAPASSKIQDLDNFVKLKSAEIAAMVEKAKETIENKDSIEQINQDDTVYFLGKQYVIKYNGDDGSGERVILMPDTAVITIYTKDKTDSKKNKKILTNWFIRKAENHIIKEFEDVVNQESEILEFLDPLYLKVKETKSYLTKNVYKTIKKKDENKIEHIVYANYKLVCYTPRHIRYLIFKKLVNFILGEEATPQEIEEYLVKKISEYEDLERETNEFKKTIKPFLTTF